MVKSAEWLKSDEEWGMNYKVISCFENLLASYSKKVSFGILSWWHYDLAKRNTWFDVYLSGLKVCINNCGCCDLQEPINALMTGCTGNLTPDSHPWGSM